MRYRRLDDDALADWPLDQYATVIQLYGAGHVGRAIAHLLGTGESGGINVRKASLTLIEVLQLRKGGGYLEFSIPARMMQPRGEISA